MGRRGFVVALTLILLIGCTATHDAGEGKLSEPEPRAEPEPLDYTFFDIGDSALGCIEERTGSRELPSLAAGTVPLPYSTVPLPYMVAVACRHELGEVVPEPILLAASDHLATGLPDCLTSQHGWTLDSSTLEGVFGAVRPSGISDQDAYQSLVDCGYAT